MKLEAVQVGGFDEAAREDVIDFLGSNSEVLLLRSSETSRQIPESQLIEHRVVQISSLDQRTSSGPLLLIKREN